MTNSFINPVITTAESVNYEQSSQRNGAADWRSSIWEIDLDAVLGTHLAAISAIDRC